jgi:small subunit ribosomal protein S1
MEMEGPIVRYQDGGIVVDLGNDLEGFVPQTQLPLAEGKSVEEETQLGQPVALKVVEVDPIHHRMVLAATDFLEMPEGFVPPPPPVYEDDEADVVEGAVHPKAAEASDSADDSEASEAAVATEADPVSEEIGGASTAKPVAEASDESQADAGAGDEKPAE